MNSLHNRHVEEALKNTQPTRCSGKEWASLARKMSKRGKAEERGDEVGDKYKNDGATAGQLVLAQVFSHVENTYILSTHLTTVKGEC